MKSNLAKKIGERQAAVREQRQVSRRAAKNGKRAPQLRLIRGDKSSRRATPVEQMTATNAFGLPTNRAVVEAAAGNATAAHIASRVEAPSVKATIIAFSAVAAAAAAIVIAFVLF